MTDKPTPNWQPLSRLPLFATMIDEAVAEAQAMLGNVQVGVQTPHVLDDHTVDRILNAYTETLEFIALYRAQLERWQDEAAVPRRRPRSSGCWASSRGSGDDGPGDHRGGPDHPHRHDRPDHGSRPGETDQCRPRHRTLVMGPLNPGGQEDRGGGT